MDTHAAFCMVNSYQGKIGWNFFHTQDMLHNPIGVRQKAFLGANINNYVVEKIYFKPTCKNLVEKLPYTTG